MNPLDTPGPDGPLPEAQADGSWFCGACRSLNRPGAPQCYCCRGQSPHQVFDAERNGRPIPAWMGLATVAIVVAMVGLTLGLSGKLSSGRAASAQTPKVAFSGTGAPSDPDDQTTASVASPTTGPTVAVDPTPDPTPTTVIYTPLPNTTPSAPVRLPKFPVSIPGVKVEYFAISGATASGLISELEAKGPKACGLADAAACFRPRFSWAWNVATNVGSGVCSVTSVAFTATYTITLPKWTGPSRVPQALVTWWKGVFGHFVWHESQHLAIARGYVPKFKKAILGGPCNQKSLERLAAAVEGQLESAQKAFDLSDSFSLPPYDG